MHYPISLVALVAFTVFATSAAAADWLQFRGNDNQSIASGAAAPVKFSKDENVAWSAPLPGKGVSGPIVVGGKVFVTASSGAVTQNRLHVVSFDVATGKKAWERQFWATGRCFHHPTSAVAAPTPASDGKRIVAFYSSNDLVCLDLDGNLLWYRGLGYDYPKAGNDVGMSSSPVIVGDTVVVQAENQGDSFAAGIDLATGETRWRVARPAGANWVSPSSVRLKDGKQLVLLQSPKALTAHDPLTGEVAWKHEASCASVPSVVSVGNRVYLPAGGLTALDPGENSASAAVAWESNRLGPGSSSPVVHGDKLYIINGAGVLACGDAKTGDLLWQQRLGGKFWATPILAGDKLYCVNQDGKCFVVSLSAEKGEIAQTNDLGEAVLASPALVDGALFVRTGSQLVKFAEK